ncbi:ATP-binding protein [Sphingomonas radiodurans]|uniref:ATP-binding protein n=1 Tax=Sphingomonas radiodurans TaxID=2890321 RepID=UPI001E51EF93|nr:ATP-binding protein [Sphingomonas radiodurans]WBH18186.1 ATP-binding protein [Sphingomonas radiodurans]
MLVVMGVLGIGVLVALIITLGEANKQRNRAITLQSHSYDVMILARTLSGTIARSEASLGRYVISGDKQLGQLYVEDWRRAGEQIERLETLTRDNDDQKARIDRLRAAYLARGEQLSLTALSTNYGKNDQALSRYYQARKAAALDEINLLLDAIIDGERTLLNRRTTAALALVERSTRAAFVLSAFGVLLLLGVIALGWLTVRALTERTIARAEANIERARAEELAIVVADATAELRVQEARLRQVQKMDAVGQLTGGIAHDFNNMLAVVIGGLELARRSHAAGSGDVARHLASATEGATRAADLTRRLLAFAREEAINPEPIAVGALIAGMRDLLDRTLGDGISVEIDDQSAGACVRADRVQMENTLLNLAVNARDAMEGRGTLTITAATASGADGELVTIAVRDTGCGMTPEVAERVFEPFFTTKPVGKGTGLGLSQIFAFTRQQGGDVTIDTAPGAGTVVRLSLPRDGTATTLAIVADVAPIGPAPLDSIVVLVVEDDPRVLAATTGALEELGHQAIACDDPLAVPALLDQHPTIDLILSDVLMPVRTGPEMIAALDPRYAHLAVLFVTGFAGETSDGNTFGEHPVLRKPFTLVGLETAIAEAMARKRPVAADRIAAE